MFCPRPVKRSTSLLRVLNDPSRLLAHRRRGRHHPTLRLRADTKSLFLGGCWPGSPRQHLPKTALPTALPMGVGCIVDTPLAPLDDRSWWNSEHEVKDIQDQIQKTTLSPPLLVPTLDDRRYNLHIHLHILFLCIPFFPFISCSSTQSTSLFVVILTLSHLNSLSPLPSGILQLRMFPIVTNMPPSRLPLCNHELCIAAPLAITQVTNSLGSWSG